MLGTSDARVFASVREPAFLIQIDSHAKLSEVKIMTKGSLFRDFGLVVENANNKSIMSLDKSEVMRAMSENGVVVFRGFDIGMDGFKSHTDALSSGFLRHMGPQARPSLS